jgi:hypothetical protein
MDWDRVCELIELDDELGTIELLRKHTAPELLFKVDRRCWLVSIIERVEQLDEDLVETDAQYSVGDLVTVAASNSKA